MIANALAELSRFIVAIIAGGGYAGILLLMAIESACIPLPSEVIMPFSGALTVAAIAAAHNRSPLNLWMVATVGALGCNLGSAVAYAVGYYGGPPLVRRFGRALWISEHELDSAHRFFERYGSATVFIARLLPVIRTFIALPAGVARMPQARFHIYTFLGSWPWCLTLAYAGMRLGSAWETDPRLKQWFHRLDVVIAACVVIAIIWFVRSRWRGRVRASASSGSQVYKTSENTRR